MIWDDIVNNNEFFMELNEADKKIKFSACSNGKY